MNTSVLLDTSFLISLVDSTREYHIQAKGFYKYFLDNQIAMVLSSIVTSEFCIKQTLEDLPISNFKPLAFNIPESYHLSQIFEEKFHHYSGEVPRNGIKDDYKICSQGSFNNITYLITEDEKFYNLLNDMVISGTITLRPIFLPDGHEKFFQVQTELEI